MPPAARLLIQQFIQQLRVKATEADVAHGRVGKPVFGCTDPKGVFAAMDTDGSGELDLEEFGEALRKLGLPLRREQAAELMAAIDTDGSGTLDQEEFAAVVQLAAGAEAEILDSAVEQRSQQAGRVPPREEEQDGGPRGRRYDRSKPPVPISWTRQERNRMTPHGKLPIGAEEIPKASTWSRATRFGDAPVGDSASIASGLIRRFVAVLGTTRRVGGLTQERATNGRFAIDPSAVFRSLDADGSGELDADEFETAAEMLGLGFSRPMVK